MTNYGEEATHIGAFDAEKLLDRDFSSPLLTLPRCSPRNTQQAAQQPCRRRMWCMRSTVKPVCFFTAVLAFRTLWTRFGGRRAKTDTKDVFSPRLYVNPLNLRSSTGLQQRRRLGQGAADAGALWLCEPQLSHHLLPAGHPAASR